MSSSVLGSLRVTLLTFGAEVQQCSPQVNPVSYATLPYELCPWG
eukprot:CAMPEP_0184301278 /NCGR_PEP_ID=MMETSP1049-20130417/11518_1 /TAXON_ID=77928 /ORGANISM="Proteomonas sulcata, Strain CCMP704" /LENGTH=43 /DNA_ID= /DNA_START= /DNA_END= /DNA_ORIENTATION=